LLRRWLMGVFFIVLLGIPGFGWVQYRQAQNLEHLTDQNFGSFEWDAFKLELRLMSLRAALLDVLTHPGSPERLARASSEYNLFAGHVSLINQGSSREAMDEQAIFQTVLTQALAFLKQADPLLEEVQPMADDRPMQALYEQTGSLHAAFHRLVLDAHNVKSLRSTQLIKEVQILDYYFALLSAVAVVLGAGWGLSAMRNLTQSSRRRRNLPSCTRNRTSAPHTTS
jgi:hypothetical protein